MRAPLLAGLLLNSFLFLPVAFRAGGRAPSPRVPRTALPEPAHEAHWDQPRLFQPSPANAPERALLCFASARSAFENAARGFDPTAQTFL